MGIFDRIKKGLQKTQRGLLDGLRSIGQGKRVLDEAALEEIEETLLAADMGIELAGDVIESIRKRSGEVAHCGVIGLTKDILRSSVSQTTTSELKESPAGPNVYLVLGVNGTGKTTTIAKLAHLLSQQGKKVVLAAADTFRAAAIDQLKVWADRLQVPVISHRAGADPSAVIYDAVEYAASRESDVVIVDTAGRLHNKDNLMEELKKIHRTIERKTGRPADETLLVLDASTGQNALQQARHFHEALGLSGIVITKLDGTAKGGIVLAINRALHIPIKYIGVGESMEDLQTFVLDQFIDALFDE